MNTSSASTSVSVTARSGDNAAGIPRLRREEVAPLAREELARFQQLLETLEPADWERPTACALWSVKDIAAHQGSHVVGLVRVGEFLDQFNPMNLRDYSRKGMNSLDAANQRQVDKRAAWTPGRVIAELRDNGEASLRGRRRFPALLRVIRLKAPGHDALFSVGYLIDTVYTRDMWMHRLDICRATGKEMVQTAAHDGRITALVVRDLDRHLRRKLAGRSVLYRLTGTAGGGWLVGSNSRADAEICMDVTDFHRLASGRIGSEQVLAQGLVRVSGDEALAGTALQHTVVLY